MLSFLKNNVMNTNFKLTIPKPCHEDWNQMTPNEQGKFCSSCAKTVVDFTKMNTHEIQEYFRSNAEKKICGHFYRKQLDSVVIQIPRQAFYQELPFQRIFLLALVFTMGTLLFSCKTETGKKQPITKVEVVDSLIVPDKEKDKCHVTSEVLGMLPRDVDSVYNVQDSIQKTKVEKAPIPESLLVDGMVVYETGEIDYKDVVCPIQEVDEYVRFPEDKNIPEKRAKQSFENRISKYVKSKFNTNIGNDLGLSPGKYSIYAQLAISSDGVVSEIRIRAPHETMKKHVYEILTGLPQFIPAKKEGKTVSTKYAVPISFVVE